MHEVLVKLIVKFAEVSNLTNKNIAMRAATEMRAQLSAGYYGNDNEVLDMWLMEILEADWLKATTDAQALLNKRSEYAERSTVEPISPREAIKAALDAGKVVRFPLDREGDYEAICPKRGYLLGHAYGSLEQFIPFYDQYDGNLEKQLDDIESYGVDLSKFWTEEN